MGACKSKCLTSCIDDADEEAAMLANQMKVIIVPILQKEIALIIQSEMQSLTNNINDKLNIINTNNNNYGVN